ncbi:MAG: hypothetical protein ABMA13_11725 [Chthoniobacteraceae bacterium]
MKRLARLIVVASVLAPQLASACSVCMGDPNSNVAKGANAAIFLMLGVLATMFSLLGAFALGIYRRSKLPPPAHTEFQQ